jgi:hypothetical protein
MKNEKKIKAQLQQVLQQMYFGEFEIIDGVNQHPLGLNFWEWLTKNQMEV